jgi:hypothetical protein
MLNPKYEYRNPKQAQNLNYQNTKYFLAVNRSYCSENLDFEHSILFRNSYFVLRIFRHILSYCLVIFILPSIGCTKVRAPDEKKVRPVLDSQKTAVYLKYLPVKIDILPLTSQLKTDDPEKPRLNIFVSLLDSFGSQLKSPCIFRFELYQRLQRSADSKGARALIWPDVDLNEPQNNEQYWRNYLRAYEFSLPLEKLDSQNFILEVTCLCPNDKRLTAEFVLDLKSNSSG